MTVCVCIMEVVYVSGGGQRADVWRIKITYYCVSKGGSPSLSNVRINARTV